MGIHIVAVHPGFYVIGSQSQNLAHICEDEPNLIVDSDGADVLPLEIEGDGLVVRILFSYREINALSALQSVVCVDVYRLGVGVDLFPEEVSELLALPLPGLGSWEPFLPPRYQSHCTSPDSSL